MEEYFDTAVVTMLKLEDVYLCHATPYRGRGAFIPFYERQGSVSFTGICIAYAEKYVILHWIFLYLLGSYSNTFDCLSFCFP